MLVSVDNNQDLMEIDLELLRKAAEATIVHEGQQADEVALHFVDRKRICDLHDVHFNDPSPTDCISFPMDPEEMAGYRHLGDVFVCPETAILYCKEQGGLPAKEMILYMVHGLLHLMGYDDIEEEDRLKMRAAEARHMANLASKGLLPEGEQQVEPKESH